MGGSQQSRDECNCMRERLYSDGHASGFSVSLVGLLTLIGVFG